MSSTTENNFPRGWFVIGGADEFKPGETKALKYFGQELVAFRGERNELIVLDAYCPHLGAHMGHGGKVIGSTLRCPFHGWRYDHTGKCVDVPYAKMIPKRACVKSWKAIDINGLSMIWHDPKGGDPEFEIPVLPEWDTPGWTPWNLNRREIKTHPREIVENVADEAHFNVVHHLVETSYFENKYEGHTATQIMKGRGSRTEIETEATYYGPAYQITKMRNIVESRLINAHTPIDENSLHLWFGVMIQESEFSDEDLENINNSLKNKGLLDRFQLTKENLGKIHEAIVLSTQQGYHEDVEIWEHKKYREAPMLCDGDGPIPKLRKWYQQFYI